MTDLAIPVDKWMSMTEFLSLTSEARNDVMNFLRWSSAEVFDLLITTLHPAPHITITYQRIVNVSIRDVGSEAQLDNNFCWVPLSENPIINHCHVAAVYVQPSWGTVANEIRRGER